MNSFGFQIGTDIESVERFKLSRINDKVFLNKIFTEEELKYCFSKNHPAPHLAARYAAKEAVFKCLSGLNVKKVHYKDIEILRNKKGMPCVKLKKINLKFVRISLAHCDDKALAFAVIK